MMARECWVPRLVGSVIVVLTPSGCCTTRWYAPAAGLRSKRPGRLRWSCAPAPRATTEDRYADMSGGSWLYGVSLVGCLSVFHVAGPGSPDRITNAAGVREHPRPPGRIWTTGSGGLASRSPTVTTYAG